MAQGRDGTWQADPAREGLSALVDGEADAGAVGGLVAQWREDSDARSAWHAYQLIGDVLRSDDLAGGGRDREFLRQVHLRLAAEPVVLAPSAGHVDMRVPADAADRRQGAAGSPEGSLAPAANGLGATRPWGRSPALRRWSAPVGVAAGVVLVAGTLLVTRFELRSDDVVAQGARSVGGGVVAARLELQPAAAASAVAVAPVVAGPASGVLIRDARLDRYLAAHKQFQGANGLGPTAGFIRSATYDVATR
jgi:sigma-E factor negative regulatory protein RseA